MLLMLLCSTAASFVRPILRRPTTLPRTSSVTAAAKQPFAWRSIAGLAAFGATAGPLVDAVHNQVLLEYDVLPITIGLVNAKTSLLIPPLLAITYALLGAVLPRAATALVGRERAFEPPAASLPPGRKALLAVASTIGIIKLSEILFASVPAGGSVAILLACCLVQWAVIDAAWASLLLAGVVAIGGPLAELPFLGLGCWHYLQPDYFPLAAVAPAGGDYAWAALNVVTGPCYFAVTTDAIALGRWLSALELD